MRLLLAEDNPAHRDLLTRSIKHRIPAATIVSVASGAGFLEHLKRGGFDVALLDYFLPDLDSLEVLAHADALPNCPPIIVISSTSEVEVLGTSLRRNGRDFLPKSDAFDPQVLHAWLHAAIDRANRQHRLIERQKDESIAVLAGGIAHDFNNMLVAIMGKATFLRELTSDSHAREYCDGILSTAERLAALARQLMAYTRGGQTQPRLVDINALIRDATTILQGNIPAGVDLQVTLADNLPPVLADESQLIQALLNLLLNACEAMNGHGTLRVQTEIQNCPQEWSCLLNERQKAGAYACVRVTDTGCGIPEHVRSRMFEPFFSTKGEGRGLGMAAVAGILRNHGGSLKLHSTPGRGTTFELYLPEPREALRPTPPPKLPALERRIAGTVLIVEDDDDVRQIAHEVLTREGYAVAVAANGAQAVHLARGAPRDAFDVMLLDAQLPDASGGRILRACRRWQQRARVIVCSGYDHESAVRSFNGTRDLLEFLPKPYGPRQLLGALDSVLSEMSPA